MPQSLQKKMDTSKVEELHKDASFEIISIPDQSSEDPTDTALWDIQASISCDDEELSPLLSDFGELFPDDTQSSSVIPFSDNGDYSNTSFLKAEIFKKTGILAQRQDVSNHPLTESHPDVIPISAFGENQNYSFSPQSSSYFESESEKCEAIGTFQVVTKPPKSKIKQLIASNEPSCFPKNAKYLVPQNATQVSNSVISKVVTIKPSFREQCDEKRGNLKRESEFMQNIHQSMEQFPKERMIVRKNLQGEISMKKAELTCSEIYDLENSGSSSVLNPPKSFTLSSITKGVWNWFCQNEFVQKMAEKAKSSMNIVITTLDPGMKNVFKPLMQVTVVTVNQYEASAVNQAFKKKFSRKVSVNTIYVSLGQFPPQPVGFQSGLRCAEAKIRFVREQKLVPLSQIVVAISPLIVETTPNRWHYCSCIMLSDPLIELLLYNFTQMIPIPNTYVNQAQLRTPDNYYYKHLGLRVTIGQIIASLTELPECDWQYALTGTSYYDTLEFTAAMLAGMYKGYVNGESC